MAGARFGTRALRSEDETTAPRAHAARLHDTVHGHAPNTDIVQLALGVAASSVLPDHTATHRLVPV